MQAITLYRYKRANGGITVSPIKPEREYTEKVRLVADEGKALTNGEVITTCVDTDTAEGWWETDNPEKEPDEPAESATYDELAQVYREGVNGIDE